MAATITRGLTLASDEEITNTTHHTIVDSATIANIDRTNFDANTKPITKSGTAPTSPSQNNISASQFPVCLTVPGLSTSP